MYTRAFPNYNPLATVDDGSCNFETTDTFGCTDPLFVEYYSQGFEANIDNGSCVI